ncbi:MAG: class I SAM-dependent methyltransferase [Comamonadaceae bacterium]|nr:class I SAM-dependent methyltransferase [Comamonadaceae bacterium]
MRPDEARALLQRLRSRIVYGGAIIVVERMLPPDSYMSIVSSRLTLAAKLEGGVSPAEIIAKEISLGGVQRPLSRDVLTDLGAVEWFRYGDFAGWVIEGVA